MKLFGKKDIGNIGERAAARYLRKRGCRILARNHYCGKNELDIVARDGAYIAFVEVKTLTFDSPEAADRRPSLAVDLAKRRRTVDAARAYLHEYPTKLCPRLDVIEVYLDRSKRMKPFKIHHIPNAFFANGSVR
ncbi:MAG: YraN family protein [Clostridia bacterium]|nr:YraN family protein [Clostridia bacterium]